MARYASATKFAFLVVCFVMQVIMCMADDPPTSGLAQLLQGATLPDTGNAVTELQDDSEYLQTYALNGIKDLFGVNVDQVNNR